MPNKSCYFLRPDGSNGYSADGTMPSDAVECTHDQYKQSELWKIDTSTKSPKIVAVKPSTKKQPNVIS